jgi:hypothetical protein
VVVKVVVEAVENKNPNQKDHRSVEDVLREVNLSVDVVLGTRVIKTTEEGKVIVYKMLINFSIMMVKITVTTGEDKEKPLGSRRIALNSPNPENRYKEVITRMHSTDMAITQISAIGKTTLKSNKRNMRMMNTEILDLGLDLGVNHAIGDTRTSIWGLQTLLILPIESLNDIPSGKYFCLLYLISFDI